MRYTPFIERAVASLAYFKDLDMAASVEDSGDYSYWFVQLVKSYSCQIMSDDITPKANLITGKSLYCRETHATQTDSSLELGVFAGGNGFRPYIPAIDLLLLLLLLLCRATTSEKVSLPQHQPMVRCYGDPQQLQSHEVWLLHPCSWLTTTIGWLPSRVRCVKEKTSREILKIELLGVPWLFHDIKIERVYDVALVAQYCQTSFICIHFKWI